MSIKADLKRYYSGFFIVWSLVSTIKGNRTMINDIAGVEKKGQNQKLFFFTLQKIILSGDFIFLEDKI
jgi:hypothetical protein